MISLRSLFCVIVCALPLSVEAAEPTPQPAIALYDAPKYQQDFKHFAYVNPDAPKQGKAVMAAIGTFDSVNPFILKGNSEGNVSLTFDTLMKQSLDEPFTMYGLVAETITVPASRAWAEFTINKAAKFADNTPITADDVIFSFNALRTKGHPAYRAYYASVLKAEKKNKHTVRFTFAAGGNRELPLILGQLPVLSKAYFDKHDFSKTTLTPILGSGAYTMSSVKAGRSATYTLRPDYWARDLAVNKGYYNIAEIRVDYYRDDTVAIEALKAGQYDIRFENVARNWAESYNVPAVTSGKLIKEERETHSPMGMQGLVMNTRNPLFADRRVREALSYAYDFEWQNKTLFYNSYTRSNSYFSNSDLGAQGLPSPAELKLLEPYRDVLPKEVFTAAFKAPVFAKPSDARANLRRALGLLQAAGWSLKDGKLQDKTGKPFAFEILLPQPTFQRVTEPYVQNLKKLGIAATSRVVDASQYTKRVDDRDFMMIIHTFGQSLNPGNEQRSYWHSSTASEKGGANLIGVKNKAVDALVEGLIAAPDRETLQTYTRALDRVLLWEHYVVPQYHIARDRFAYWNKFGQPEVKPLYDVGFPAVWWVK